MTKVVLYDSVFGNTAKIAKIIAENLGADTELLSVAKATTQDLQGISLLVVGSPTRSFRATPALMAFLKLLGKDSLKGVKTAAFDTRVDIKKVNNGFLTFMVNLFGYAAKPISNKLTKLGGAQIAEPMGFFVDDKEGPNSKGEEARAEEWAKTLIKSL